MKQRATSNRKSVQKIRVESVIMNIKEPWQELQPYKKMLNDDIKCLFCLFEHYSLFNFLLRLGLHC